MPITSSAKKALRVSRHKRQFNLARKTTMTAIVKKVRGLIASKKTAEAAKLLPLAYQAIDKAAKTKLIKKNAAARKKSRLALALEKAS
jgi:small subunit ribosomal protein S20